MASLVDLPVVKFVRKAISGGSTLSETQIGYNAAASGNEAACTYQIEPDGDMTKITIDTHYIGADPGNLLTDPFAHSARTAAMQYLDSIRASVYYRPMVKRELARGKTYAAKYSESWGDIVLMNNTTTLISGVTLLSAEITDDSDLHAVGLRFVFGKIADVAAA